MGLYHTPRIRETKPTIAGSGEGARPEPATLRGIGLADELPKALFWRDRARTMFAHSSSIDKAGLPCAQYSANS